MGIDDESPESPGARTLEHLRRVVVDGCLKVLAVVGGLAVVAGINSTLLGDGWSTPTLVLTVSYLLAYAAVLVGAFASVSPGVQRAILFTTAFAIALVALLESGLLGEGRLFAFAWTIFVALIVGVRAGIGAAVTGVGLVFVVGMARTFADERVLGLFRVDPRFDDLNHWLTASVIYFVCVVAAVVPLLYLSRHLEGALTKAERAEAQYRQLSEQFRHAQKMEAFGQLAGGVAHDFNNLLTPIVGHAGFALDELAASHPAREELDQILAAADRAAALTSKILAFSRRQPMTLRTVELNAAIRAFEGLARRIIESNIVLESRLVGDALPLRADPVAIDQILMNLCVNARDAMPSGGRIVIETARVDGPEGPQARLSVVDDGTGMDPETMQRVFEPFFTTKAEGRGTGLGLSVVFGVVHQLAGRIEVDSRLGVGTRFDILLPLTTETSVEEIPPSASPSGDETVLLVEDDVNVRRVLAEQLRSGGYTVVEIGDPELAVSQNADTNVELLVSDVVMPNLSGPQLFAKLQLERPGLKVLFVSGYPKELPSSEASPPRRLLRKPFTKEELLAAVREVLDEPDPR